MFDYINRIEMLRKPEEQERLKKEMPPILADSEEEKEDKKEETTPSSDSLPQIKGILADSEEEKEEENEETSLPSLSDSLAQNKGDANGKNTDNVARKPETSGERTVCGFGNVEENKEALRGNSAGEVPVEELSLSPKKTDINMAETNGNGPREEPAEVKSLDLLKSDCSSNTDNAKETCNCFERPTEQTVQSNKDVEPNKSTQQVIELSDSDSDSEMPAEGEEVWYYLDPQEMVQGPFSMILLRGWKNKGFFDEDFKVWHKGQSRGDAILLSRASRYSF
ncbi:hypothetical protein LUZ61_011982 [Rhynchospora tenuis]|uniref:GYF domain-containing protein n=1 Tax=Rhynchospora tenuis TaxID=198213 RepID=A0AAD6A229_9POAL|nr:hypothetical protein LUZ61_011982 [Rhynchospora tenuis]